jgi:hypothetical protein
MECYTECKGCLAVERQRVPLLRGTEEKREEVTMKRILLTFMVVALVLAGVYSAHAIHQTQAEGTKIVIPGADAAKLYKFMTLPKPYFERFNLWPGIGKLHAGTNPHSPFLTTYVNDAALASIKEMKEMPDGACIINEEYTADKKLKALTVMYKVKGYNPEAGDWFWVKYDSLNGYVLESGKPESCVSCHGDKKGSDYLFSK